MHRVKFYSIQLSKKSRNSITTIYTVGLYLDKKNIISVKIDRNKTTMQKRLLYDLRELYDLFKKSEKLFSWSSLNYVPNIVFLLGDSWNSICVCTIHRNCKLILKRIDIQNLSWNSEK